jgi:hypothetical protein
VRGRPPEAAFEPAQSVSLAQALMHLLTAAMKGMVALTGLEAVSNGIQFMIDEDAGPVREEDHPPEPAVGLQGKSGSAAIDSFILRRPHDVLPDVLPLRFNVFDGGGRTLVVIGVHRLWRDPGGEILLGLPISGADVGGTR